MDNSYRWLRVLLFIIFVCIAAYLSYGFLQEMQQEVVRNAITFGNYSPPLAPPTPIYKNVLVVIFLLPLVLMGWIASTLTWSSLLSFLLIIGILTELAYLYLLTVLVFRGILLFVHKAQKSTTTT